MPSHSSRGEDGEKKRKSEDDNSQVEEEAPAEKKIKIVDGIAIPKPAPIRKSEKKKHEPARVIRAKQREERKAEARKNALENRKKQIEEGTFDWEADERRRKERQLNQMVKAEIAKRERAGEFGVVLPHPSVMLQMEKEAHARGEPFIHPSRLGYDIPPDTPFEKCKKVSYKDEKYKREKLKREAKRDVKARLRALMFGEEYVPESELTPEQKKQRRQQEKDKARAERRAKREAKALEEAEKEALLEFEAELARENGDITEKTGEEPEVENEPKKSKQEEKAERRRKMNEAETARRARLDAEAAAAAAEAQNGVSSPEDEPTDEDKNDDELIKPLATSGGFDLSADEIKLGVNVAGRVKKIPGVGRVDKYPTKSEKKMRKLEARAKDTGMTLEEYKAKLDKEREEEEAPEKARLAELRASRGGLDAKQWHRYCRMAEEDGKEKAQEFFLECVKRNRVKEEAKANGIEIKKEPQITYPVLGMDGIKAPALTNGHTSPKDGDSDTDEDSTKNKISKKKMEKYAAKAAAKGQTVEEYIERHEFKKAKMAAREATKAIKASRIQVMEDSVDVQVLPAHPRADETKKARSSSFSVNGAKHAHQDLGFILDTKGDATLDGTKTPTAETRFVIDRSGDADLKNNPPKLIWHPDMLGDRRVKDLSKPERLARLEWMRERRAAKNAAMGKNPLSKKERHKKRVEKKMRQRDRLVAEIMREGGKAREEVTREELMNARRKAKRIQRELKREKRNKVIFRKKLGGGLRGLLGGKISEGGGGPRVDLVRLGAGGMAPMG